MKKAVFVLGMALVVLAGCQPSPQPMPTATPTSLPPTATPTSLPPTATPTSLPPTATPTSLPPTATPTSLPPATPTLSPSPTPTPEPAPTGPTPTAAPITKMEELVGVWLQDGYYQFKGDGTFRVAPSTEALEVDPYIEGEFWFEGGQFFIKDIAGVPGWDVCVGRPAGSYEVQGAVRDYFILVPIDDPCKARDYALRTKPFRWFSP